MPSTAKRVRIGSPLAPTASDQRPQRGQHRADRPRPPRRPAFNASGVCAHVLEETQRVAVGGEPRGDQVRDRRHVRGAARRRRGDADEPLAVRALRRSRRGLRRGAEVAGIAAVGADDGLAGGGPRSRRRPSASRPESGAPVWRRCPTARRPRARAGAGANARAAGVDGVAAPPPPPPQPARAARPAAREGEDELPGTQGHVGLRGIRVGAHDRGPGRRASMRREVARADAARAADRRSIVCRRGRPAQRGRGSRCSSASSAPEREHRGRRGEPGPQRAERSATQPVATGPTIWLAANATVKVSPSRRPTRAWAAGA